jgi:hypothetical protein
MSIVLNVLSIILLFLIWGISYSIISSIFISFSKTPLVLSINGFVSSALGCFLAIYLSNLALLIFDVKLSIYPIIGWGGLQLLGAARSGTSILLQNQMLDSHEKALLENQDGVSLEVKKYTSLGQFWGLLLGLIVGLLFLVLTS